MTRRSKIQIFKRSCLIILLFSVCFAGYGVYKVNMANQIMADVETEIQTAMGIMEETLCKTEENLQQLDVIYVTAEKYNLPLELVVAIMRVESNFDTTAISPTGCEGLMQVSPIHTTADLLDLRVNVETACGLLENIQKDCSNLHQVLGVYNRGSVGYQRYVARTNTEISNYSKKVIALMEELQNT